MRITEAKPLEKYKLFVRFDDGVSGVVDLGDIAGRGVFEAWKRDDVSEQVRITRLRTLEWLGEFDLCPIRFISSSPASSQRKFFPLCANG